MAESVLVDPLPAPSGSVLERAQSVARIAATFAGDVDRDSRFPREAVDGLRSARLLGAFVPRALGGEGCGFQELTWACQALGQQCAATGMIFAMHQIQVASLVRHGLPAPWFDSYLRTLADRQLLIASVTSEAGVGGDLRTSLCAIEADGPRFRVQKEATTISYGAEADALLLTARRSKDAAANDQVMVLLRREDTALEKTGEWNTLGMRGTCSPGFRVRAAGSLEQVVPVPFADICPQSQVPFSHVLWSGVWLGIATDAANRARAYVRAEARRRPGVTPPASLRLAELMSLLQLMRNNVLGVAKECEELMASPEGNEALSAMGFVLRMNNLKISCSQLVVQIVAQALLICGIGGYRNDGKFSLGRHLRDSHSAALMINNDRIHATNAQLLLVHKDEQP